jgi:lysyl-tRNA synthetase class 2
MWQPSCSVEMLKTRAEFYALIRAFFYERNILEVETPVISYATATDPHLESVVVSLKQQPDQTAQQYFLQTSPEFPMKRLLAAGSGPIYQICKTFRNGETGSRHNPEFSMLEWYRPGFSLFELRDEVSALLKRVLGITTVKTLTYRDAFLLYVQIDPFKISDQKLEEKARMLAGYCGPKVERDDYLNLLMSVCIEPQLGKQTNGELSALFLCDYPSSQASLAKVRLSSEGELVAERFELYVDGLELANAYFELTDADEQLRRFQQDNSQRLALGLPKIPFDENLINALESGLPDSAGIALGLDRLLMLKEGANSISQVLAFPIDSA